MMVRNEMGRYLSKSLASGQAVAEAGGGYLIVTDDHSTDATRDVVRRYTSLLQETDEPLFWKHEGQARQRHLDYAANWIKDGDWVLSLDADETINKPELVAEIVKQANPIDDAVGIPLYEFWTPTQYRVDGWWFGTMSSRLFRYRTGGKMADKQMASGSEPTYVADSVFAGRWVKQTDVHLLHWGYLNPVDRERKYLAYSKRLGGHGHHSMHVDSIIKQPQLREYRG
jgi:glycosyltransferase involved in cell wall biosynthesis